MEHEEGKKTLKYMCLIIAEALGLLQTTEFPFSG